MDNDDLPSSDNVGVWILVAGGIIAFIVPGMWWLGVLWLVAAAVVKIDGRRKKTPPDRHWDVTNRPWH